MKYLGLLVSLFITINTVAQNYPLFNPLVNIYKSNTLNEVLDNLKKQKSFKGQITKDSIAERYIISGQWQQQALTVKMDNSSFKVIVNFDSEKNYKDFFSAAKQFFVQYASISEPEDNAVFPCDVSLFKKTDFKEGNLQIAFWQCPLYPEKPVSFKLIITRKFYCGN